MSTAVAPIAPISRPWALRYSIRHRDGVMGGTVTIHLQKLPAGCSPLDAARGLLALRCPGATPILPRAVLLEDPE